MSLGEYEEIHNQHIEAVRNAGIKHYMFNGPTSEKYWEQKIKVVIINMESYGYDKSGFVNVNKDNTLLGWVMNKKRTNTNKYAVVFAAALKKSLVNNTVVGLDYIKSTYHNYDEIEKTLNEISIYNIKPTSNSEVKQDYKGIVNCNSGEVGKYFEKEIMSLEPSIIIVSGKAALKAFKRLFEIKDNFKESSGIIKYNNILVAAIRHFSRPSYINWLRMIDKIQKKLTTDSI